MNIVIHRTYEIITPESAEHGECEEAGFLSEDEIVGFRELVGLLEEHPYASSSNPGPRDWFTSGADEDYTTGETRYTSIHLANPDDPRQARYWGLAVRYRKAIDDKRRERERREWEDRALGRALTAMRGY